jgi:hypothetical protein
MCLPLIGQTLSGKALRGLPQRQLSLDIALKDALAALTLALHLGVAAADGPKVWRAD